MSTRSDRKVKELAADMANGVRSWGGVAIVEDDVEQARDEMDKMAERVQLANTTPLFMSRDQVYNRDVDSMSASIIKSVLPPGYRETPDRLHLPAVSLVSIATGDYVPATLEAVAMCSERVQFANTFLFADTDTGENTVTIPKLRTREEVSIFHLFELPKYRDQFASHILRVQWDGFILNPDAWDDKWLEYDYIGAPWDNKEVGNDGFCLMSRRLLEAIAALNLEPTAEACYPADGLLSRKELVRGRDWNPHRPTYRAQLEAAGIKFAPFDVARKFAVECEPWYGQFGFHGGGNLIEVVKHGLNLTGSRWSGGKTQEYTDPVQVAIAGPNLDLFNCLQAAHDAESHGKFEDAEAYYKAILNIDRDQHEASRHYAMLLSNLDRGPEAVKLLEYTCAKEAHSHFSLFLLANAHNCIPGHKREAGRLYQHVLESVPTCAFYHWCWGHYLLGEGDLEHGFNEIRWGYACQKRNPRALQPEWNGEWLGPNKRLYICSEFGMGDNILYGRFLQDAKERSGAWVTLEVYEPLVPLYQERGVAADEIVALDQTNFAIRRPFDEWVNGISLARLAGVKDFDHLSRTNRPDFLRKKGLRSYQEIMSTFRVGLAWRGNPRNPIDRYRSMVISDFEPLFGIKGVQFVNLQYGRGPQDEYPGLSMETPNIATTDKLAAAMESCDLVVSADTLVANLAGALALPVAAMVTSQSDYRWTHEGEKTAWYPNATTYWKTGKTWKEPMDAVADKIRERLRRI